MCEINVCMLGCLIQTEGERKSFQQMLSVSSLHYMLSNFTTALKADVDCLETSWCLPTMENCINLLAAKAITEVFGATASFTQQQPATTHQLVGDCTLVTGGCRGH